MPGRPARLGCRAAGDVTNVAPTGPATAPSVNPAAVTGGSTPGVPDARSSSRRAALAGRYTARGVEHDVFVVQLSSMRWLVLDVTVSDVVIVDTLECFDDRFDQAC